MLRIKKMIANTFWYMLNLLIVWYSYHVTPWCCWKCGKFSMWVVYRRHSDIQSFFPEFLKSWWCAQAPVFTTALCDSKCNKSWESSLWDKMTKTHYFYSVKIQPIHSFSLLIASLRHEGKCDRFFQYMYNRTTERGGHTDNVKIPNYLNTVWWAGLGKVEFPSSW